MIKLFGMKNALIFNIQIISQIWSHKNVVPDTYFNQGIFVFLWQDLLMLTGIAQ